MSRLLASDDGPLPGAVNMQRDAAMLAAQRPADGPVLRLYRWSPPAVSLGYHQDPAGFDAAALAARGYDLVRRPTGGRAILHAQELTYAVAGASPSPLFGATLHETYAAINRALTMFLERLGVRPDIARGESLAQARGLLCFHSAGQHEILVQGRKLIGSAQRRTAGVFLQHGSILTGPAHAELAELAAPPAARDELLATTTDLERVLGRRLAEADLAALARELAAAFAETWELQLVWR